MRRHTLLAGAIVLMLTTLVGHAQTTTGTRLDMALMSFFGGNRSIRVTVSNIGARGSSARVRMIIYDAADNVLSSTNEVTLRHDQPVIHSLRLTQYTGLVPARVSIWIEGETEGTAPHAVVEQVDTDSLVITPKGMCGPPAGRTDPVMFSLDESAGSGGAGCGCGGFGFKVSNYTIGG